MSEMYGEDLLLHEFVTREWYPRFQKQFGPGLDQAVAVFKENRARRFSRRKYYQSRLNHHLVLRSYGRFFTTA